MSFTTTDSLKDNLILADKFICYSLEGCISFCEVPFTVTLGDNCTKNHLFIVMYMVGNYASHKKKFICGCI